MFTKARTGKVAHVQKKPIPPSSQIKLHLVDSEAVDLGQVTLTSALSLIKPFTHLTPMSDSPGFQIKPLKNYDPDLPQNRKGHMQAFKRGGHDKEFYLSTGTTPRHLKHVLEKSCEFILRGARMEFQLQQKRGGPTIDHALEHSPHLRPDSILRAMPEGTMMLAHPCIFPEIKKGSQKKADLDHPMKWTMEHPASLKRSSGHETPKWMKQMATWDVKLENDPELGVKTPVRTMWQYSKKLHGNKRIYRTDHSTLRRPVHEKVGSETKNT